MAIEAPWQMMIALGISGFLNAPNMILGGLAGWFSAAGPRSFVLALAFVFLAPVSLYFVLLHILDPYGMFVSMNFPQMVQLKMGIATYVGVVLAMMLLFVPMRAARLAWRKQKVLLEALI